MKRVILYVMAAVIGEDGYKMATGGYMDEVDRCLHPTKR